MKYKIVLTFLVAVYAAFIACGPNSSTKTDSNVDTVNAKAESVKYRNLDTAEDCAKPTKYPNQDKPMALMMRQMADNAQKMKNKLEASEKIDAKDFPFIRFHLVEPTDPNVLQPQFYENARSFQEAHKALLNAPQVKQKEMYTAYINQCINCHQTYCSGPLKRIKKLVLN